MTDWKAITKTLVTMFQEVGVGAVCVDGSGNPFAFPPPVLLVACGPVLEVEELTVKKVREFLFRERNCRALRRPAAVIFGTRPEGGSTVAVGVGTLVRDATLAGRLTKRTALRVVSLCEEVPVGT